MNGLKSLLNASPGWPMGLGRIMLGLIWLASLRWKLPPDFEPTGEVEGLRGWLEQEVQNPGFAFYGELIDSVVLPNFTLFAWLIFLAELIIGLLLVTGIAIRPAAFGGFLLSLNLWVGLREIEWEWTYVLMMAWHLGVLFSPASASLSLGSLRNGSDTAPSDTVPVATGSYGKGSLGEAILRSGLGLVTLVTWLDNINKDFYDGENFVEFFDWVARPAEEGGNGASLSFVHSLVDSTILQAPELFGWFMTFLELAIAIGLLFGIFTRAASFAATGFFGSLFLVYFGGEEWIGIYVLLAAAAGVTFLRWGGRKFGVDEALAAKQGESPLTLVW